MQLVELVLHNVGVYHGRQTIDLTTPPDRPVILIGGLNGCGKTTFLDALQLVLYGNRARLSNRGSQAYEDFLRDTISHKVSPTDGASISLTFDVAIDGQTRRYQVTRAWAAAGKRTKESLDVLVDGDWSRTLSSGWADHVEELLPLEIASLFFFDGEKIEALADPDRASSVIQTAVHSLLGISTLEQLRTDLLALQRRQVPPGEEAAFDQRVADLTEEHQRLQAQLDETTQRRGRIRQDLARANKDVQQAQRAYQRDGGDLYDQRVALQSNRDATAARLRDIYDKLRGVAEGQLPLALVAGQLRDVITQAQAELEAIEAEHLKTLLAERDAWLLDNLPARSRPAAKKLLDEDRAKRDTPAATPAYLHLTREQVQHLAATPARIADAQRQAQNLLTETAALTTRLDELDSALAGVPSDDGIAALQQALDSARAAHARLQGQLDIIDEDVERLRRERTHTEEQLARAEADRLRTAVQRADVARTIGHTDRVRETLAILRQRLVERHIGRIEVATLDCFSTLMRKEGLVTDLRIDPLTYALSLFDQSGTQVPPSRLSAGERQLLAVALLWGLARVAGNRLPAVIDTPLGRLDSQHREHLVDLYFPQAAAQVLLLSTDEEIDQRLLRRLAPSVGQTYTLQHDDKAHVTWVSPGYWWPLEASADVA